MNDTLETALSWTDERVERLKALFAERLSASQIGAELGVTRNAVIGKAHRLGLRREKSVQLGRRPRKRKPPGSPKPIRFQPFREPPAMPVVPFTPITDDQMIPQAQRCGLFDLTNTTCRWPIGEGPNLFFCGGPADEAKGRTYCAGHAARAINQRKAHGPTKIAA